MWEGEYHHAVLFARFEVSEMQQNKYTVDQLLKASGTNYYICGKQLQNLSAFYWSKYILFLFKKYVDNGHKCRQDYDTGPDDARVAHEAVDQTQKC